VRQVFRPSGTNQRHEVAPPPAPSGQSASALALVLLCFVVCPAAARQAAQGDSAGRGSSRLLLSPHRTIPTIQRRRSRASATPGSSTPAAAWRRFLSAASARLVSGDDGRRHRRALRSTNNWNQPTGDLPACFPGVWMRVGDGPWRAFWRSRAHLGCPSSAHLDYDGRFSERASPTRIPAAARSPTAPRLSPLIPHDIKNSSFPGAAFVFEIRNTLKVRIDVSAARSPGKTCSARRDGGAWAVP